jgi:CheY-like chemotaxis protein
VAEISREEFLNHLHDALNHLYNADQLRKSPLAELFGIGNRFDTSAALKKNLTDAIESLKPHVSEPDNSKTWRLYESLYCCFIQQLNQQIVADQLCISPRQLRREQHNALQHLADVLWQKYNLGDPVTQENAGEASALIGEVSWLMDAQPVSPNQLREEIQAALEVVQPLANKTGAALHSAVSQEMPGLAVHPVVLNQILISLLDMAIHAAGSGSVHIAASKRTAAVELSIHVTPHNVLAATHADVQTSLQVAGELVRISGGRLVSQSAQNPLPIHLILPALEQFPVLVVDDNEDSLQLFKRYTAGTRYNLTCLRDAGALLEQIEAIRPRIIMLDIMMPKENGWIVLGRLRQHPPTAETPIIICTVLPQEKLALSLGANAYLKKPVSRQEFLEALDQQFSLLEPEFS